jgi:hypothetical protein
MTDKSSSTTAQNAHKPSADAGTPFQAMFGMWKVEMLKVADESEKMAERSLVEMKRATVESSRLFESQVELGANMMRASFDGVRRMWNV